MSDRRAKRAPGDERENFQLVLRRRVRAHGNRMVEAAVVGVLGWMATGNPWVAAWFAAVLATGLVETHVSRRALDAPEPWSRRRSAAAAQAASAVVFAAVAAFLVAHGSAAGLAGACFILCAVSLANALKSSGSRLATLALVPPPAAGLILAPLWVGFTGTDMPLGDTLLMALGGVGYIVFIMHASGTIAAEREAVRRGAQEAETGKQRWRMVFHNSPMPRICFDATNLYARLDGAARGRTRLGDVLLEQYGERRLLSEDVTLIEANGEARGLFARYGGVGAFDDDFLPVFAEALNGLDDEGVIPPFEAPMRSADGETRIVRVHYRVTSANGAPWSLCLGTYDDVTEARRAALAQDEARQAAEEANRTKSDFLALMSHEIRTPLNGVLGMAQAMDLEPLEAQQRDRLRVIRESGSALLELLDDLLDISRIEAGRLALEADDFDLRAVAESVHTAFAAEAAAKDLAFRLEVDPALAGLWRGDGARVRQILTNLVSNGLKFTPQGVVAMSLARRPGGVRIEVTDTGIGIAPDRVGRLFEKFVQADDSTTRAYGGTGLGLAICQELTRAMDGIITVSSAPGMGSTFMIELPLRRAVQDEAPATAPGALADSGLRVLAAEDNDVNRMVLKTLLNQLGIEPTIVENGAEAVRAWESAHWDLILMDVQMPQMDGPTATMTIRAREAVLSRPRTPILAVTANTMPHQVASYRAAGMDDVVSKPLNAAELFAAVQAAAEPGPAEITHAEARIAS